MAPDGGVQLGDSWRSYDEIIGWKEPDRDVDGPVMYLIYTIVVTPIVWLMFTLFLDPETNGSVGLDSNEIVVIISVLLIYSIILFGFIASTLEYYKYERNITLTTSLEHGVVKQLVQGFLEESVIEYSDKPPMGPKWYYPGGIFTQLRLSHHPISIFIHDNLSGRLKDKRTMQLGPATRRNKKIMVHIARSLLVFLIERYPRGETCEQSDRLGPWIARSS